MQHKTKKIWLIALLSLLIVALFAASFTYARYYKETGVTGGKYDDTIEFVGANKYIVYTPEELVAAIENGYSYIEIAEDVEDPFIITDGVTDVSANLVLDINGHNLVRNSRNPLIDVQENVSVVIVYDSKASGSFYNPVGSMLQASGGTLTIATGNFTSGPKAEDLYAAAGDRVSDMENTTYRYFEREGMGDGEIRNRSGEKYTEVTENKPAMPKLTGNVFLDTIGTEFKAKYPELGGEDTFLIYTEETVETPEDATVVDFSPLCDVASCDFYYYYEKSTEGSGEDKTTTYAVIYGYHDVMKGAEQQITKTGFNEPEDAVINSGDAVIWPYAAVRMTEGEAFIRGGTYTNQFGTAQSYGIYARGGDLAISGSSTSFSAIEDGVCVRCETTIVDGVTYVPQLNISGTPQFFSVNNETVQVEGGDIVVSSGTAKVKADNSTGIYIEGGNLEVASTATLDVTAEITESSTGAIYHSPDGVYVGGGSLLVYGALDVKFTGLSNDAFERGDTYLTQQIKSYAVRVEAASGSETKVTIAAGDITNLIGGGGIYVGGGTVTLGTKDAGNSNLSVYTQGSSADNDSHYVSGGDWQYDWTITGGHAVEVQGGSLTVNSGTYTAEMGNGILVRNLEGSDQSYTVTVNNGIFAGYNGSGRRVGPGAFYALKVMGGPLTLNVTGGTFGKDNTDNFRTNGSAFVMGDPVNKKRATVNVTGGNYYSYQSDCFSIFRYVDIAFETENITMNAVRNNNSDVFAAVAVQDDLVYNDNEHEARGSRIEIAGGKYTGVGYGLWYGASVDAVAVSGGTFTGTNEAGLYFGVAPNGSNVQLSGGTFYGPKNDVRLSHSWGIPQPSNNANYNAIDGQDIDYSRILLAGYFANGDTQYDGSVNNGAETAEGTYTTTKILTRLKERGEVEVERYGPWYTTHLVFSKITVQ